MADREQAPQHKRTREQAPPQRAGAWLSQGVECLVQDIGERAQRSGADFDVIVVGSGYGGAIAASMLAGRRKPDGGALGVCVLERGKEYLPGSFPARMADLAGHTRFSSDGAAGARGTPDGLFDIKAGTDVSALVANGLGGGSLINAGVMVEPPDAVRASLEAATGPLQDYYRRARELLGAENNTILDHESGRPPLKYVALKTLAQRLGRGAAFQAAPITVAMRQKNNSAGVPLEACIECGDCATGCNFNAKDSLDTNLLASAQRHGARLYTGATVVRIERDEEQGRWRLHAQYTDASMRKRMPDGFILYAGRVVLAAGTYGSTEILMRSASDTLTFSPMLGEKFSSNGDMITVAYGQQQEANALADENDAPGARKVGPTITGMIRIAPRAESGEGDMLVEELAVPGPMRRLFEEIVSTAHTLHGLGRHDSSVHTRFDDAHDPCAVDGRAMRHSSVLAVMGDDGAAGRMELVGRATAADGGLRVRWPDLRHHRLFERQAALLAEGGAAPHGAAAENGTILPNPLWKLLPDDMGYLLKGRRGPLLTVHPLGGCPIGASAAHGAVDGNGQVYAAGRAVHPGLVVLDGSIVPCALAANPALTIAALSLRAVENLCREWQLGAQGKPAALAPRPVFRIVPALARAEVKPTLVQFVERMSGKARLAGRDGVVDDYMLELTMHFDPVELAAMFLPEKETPVAPRRRLRVGAGSTLRVCLLSDWDAWRAARVSDPAALPTVQLEAKLSGTLDLFHRETSIHPQRVARTLGPWLRNRGLRDTWQWMFGQEREQDKAQQESGLDRLRGALALASRGGEVRRFDYNLGIEAASAPGGKFDAAAVALVRIAGEKRLTYGVASNPWSQLMRMTLTRFPGLDKAARPAVLELDTGFLVDQEVPLMRIVGQHDQPSALADVAALAGYLLRLLLSIHMWSFRKPDTPSRRTPQRLPGPLPGLRMDIVHLPFPDHQGKKVAARLTRYRAADVDAAAPPILMIHGYSASGTTFAHEAVNPNLAGHMCARGRDVWVLDMRTSSGMPSATHPWKFEDAAHNDIPVAVARVCLETGHPKIDVVAHCMGAAMFGMAVLGEPAAGEPWEQERRALPGRVNSLLLSQVGPLVVFSQANIFRAYLMGYARHLMPNLKFPFKVSGKASMADELIDRLLATIPYPDQEFALENPLLPWQRADFAGTRHRMDALYGRDFQLANIDAAILERIDDFFGPYSLVTLNQAIHFARLKTITNHAGRNPYVSREQLKARWIFPTHSIHGVENGLSDVSTLDRMEHILKDAGCSFSKRAFEGFGHQDCFIGRNAAQVFEEIARFQGEVANDARAAAAPPTPVAAAGAAKAPTAPGVQLIARMPWTGPLLTIGPAPGRFSLGHAVFAGAACSPVLHRALYIVFVPVIQRDGHYLICDQHGQALAPHAMPEAAGVFLRSAPGDDPDGWVRLAAPAAPPGAAGMLMLMIHNAPEALEPHTPLRPDLAVPGPGKGGLEWYSMPGAEAHWQQAAHIWETAIALPLSHALAALLDSTPGTALSRALIPATVEAPGVFGKLRPAMAAAPAEKTMRRLCFAAASCQYPAGILDSEPAFASYRRLAKLLDSPDPAKNKPGFITLLGDQIYADASAGLFDPSERDDRYVRPHEKLLGNEHVQRVLTRIPAYMMLDDHEIADNWEPRAGPGGKDADLEDGVRAYLKFQRNAGSGSHGTPGHSLSYSFTQGGLPFLMLDTRTGRAPRTPFTVGSAAIADLDFVTTWLGEQQAASPRDPKFIASASIVAPFRMGPPGAADGAHRLRSDSWAGYPASLHALLAFIADHKIANVVLLSGDEHISCDATISITPPRGKAVQIRAIHSSALYAPYPFANAQLADMAEPESSFTFEFPAGSKRSYACEVSARYKPGDGFAVITASESDKGWRIDCEFDRA